MPCSLRRPQAPRQPILQWSTKRSAIRTSVPRRHDTFTGVRWCARAGAKHKAVRGDRSRGVSCECRLHSFQHSESVLRSTASNAGRIRHSPRTACKEDAPRARRAEGESEPNANRNSHAFFCSNLHAHHSFQCNHICPRGLRRLLSNTATYTAYPYTTVTSHTSHMSLSRGQTLTDGRGAKPRTARTLSVVHRTDKYCALGNEHVMLATCACV